MKRKKVQVNLMKHGGLYRGVGSALRPSSKEEKKKRGGREQLQKQKGRRVTNKNGSIDQNTFADFGEVSGGKSTEQLFGNAEWTSNSFLHWLENLKRGKMSNNKKKNHNNNQLTWNEHMRVSSTDIIAPALSNSPQLPTTVGRDAFVIMPFSSAAARRTQMRPWGVVTHHVRPV